MINKKKIVVCAVSAVAFLILSVLRQVVEEDKRLSMMNPQYPRRRHPPPPPASSSSLREPLDVDRRAKTGRDEAKNTENTTTTAAATNVLHTCSCLAKNGNDDDGVSSSPTLLPPRGRFRWLHIPKTGTSFISTLYSHSCSTERGRIDLDISPHYREGCGACFDFALIGRYPPELYCRRDSFDSLETQHRSLNAAEVRRARDAPLSSLSSFSSSSATPNSSNVEAERERIDVVGFFRHPRNRIVSAYHDGMHASGMGRGKYQEMKLQCKGNVTCFATHPAMGGCMAKMLSGASCAQDPSSIQKQQDGGGKGKKTAEKKGEDEVGTTKNKLSGGGINVLESLAALEAMSFVGITEDWNESVCQFHKLFGGLPSQGQFQNIHRGKKGSISFLSESYQDEIDEAVYEAALEKFRRLVGDSPCYEAVEVPAAPGSSVFHSPQEDDEDSQAAVVAVSNVCAPKSCAQLSMQCGEHPDGCGGIVSCGVCGSSVRDNLPDDWGHMCVEGTCVRTCQHWEEEGLWFKNVDGKDGHKRSHVEWMAELVRRGAPVDVGDNSGGSNATRLQITNEVTNWGLSSVRMTRSVAAKWRPQLEIMTNEDVDHVTPSDAVRLCADACSSVESNHKKFASEFCTCGTYPHTYLKDPPTLEEYRQSHDLVPLQKNATANIREDIRRLRPYHLRILSNHSLPRCCASRDASPRKRPNEGRQTEKGSFLQVWRNGFVWADFFESIYLGPCSDMYEDCEEAGRQRRRGGSEEEKGATVVVLDISGHICHIGRDAGRVTTLPMKRHYLRLEPPKKGIMDGPPV